MKSFRRLNIFCLMALYSVSTSAQVVHDNRIIDSIDKIFGKGWDFVSRSNLCSFTEASFDEYKQVRCGIMVDGKFRYAHEGDDGWGPNSFDSEWMQQFTDNIIFESAALDVYRFNKCQKDYFSAMSSGTPRLENLKTASYQMFNQVKDNIRSYDQEVSQRVGQMESEVQVHVMSTKPTSDYRIMSSLEKSAEDTAPNREVISQLASTIPLGNRPQMRDFITRAARENLGAEEFKKGYETTLRILGVEAKNNYDLMAKKIIDHTDPEQPIFEVDNSLKKSLFKNGVVDNILVENNLEDFNESNYMCRYRSQLRGQEVRLWAELALAAALTPATGGFTGYTIASLRLATILEKSAMARSVANVASKGVSIVRGTKAGRLAMMGSYGTVDFGLTALEAKRECLTPNYVASKSTGVCNAESQYDIVIAEASTTTCMLGLSVSALTGISLTRSIKKASSVSN